MFIARTALCRAGASALGCGMRGDAVRAETVPVRSGKDAIMLSGKKGWPLAAVRQARSDDVKRRVERAIGELLCAGCSVSFYAVADRAQVARSTLYRRDDLRTLVRAACEVSDVRSGVSDADEFTRAFACDRVEGALSREVLLRAENAALRRRLQDAYRDIACLEDAACSLAAEALPTRRVYSACAWRAVA